LDNYLLPFLLSPSFYATNNDLLLSLSLSAHPFSNPLVLHKDAVDSKNSIPPNICYLYLITSPYVGVSNSILLFIHILTPSTTSTTLI